MILTLLAALVPAQAANHELSVETAQLDNRDADYRLYDDREYMPSQGLRAGVKVHDRVAVIAGWHRIHRGATVFTATDDSFVAAFQANTWTLGAKADLSLAALDRPFFDRVFPYLTVQAVGLQAATRLDDDPDDRDNIGQVKRNALAPGVRATAGVELHIWRPTRGPSVAWHGEIGYGEIGRLNFDELGDIKPGGFAASTGIGVRF